MPDISSNLGLNLPKGADTFDYDVFLRQNFQKIDDQLKPVATETFTATEGQSVFTLSNSYTPGKGELNVKVDGVPQILGSGYTETSATSITLSEGLIAGQVVEVRIGGIIPESDARFSSIESSLADIATFVNADKTGVTPASSSINNLIASASDGDEIRFHKGTYLIDSPIIWNKKVTLVADGRVTLKASANIEAIIKATGFTSYTDVHLNGFFLDGNNKANHCILLDGSSLYTVKTVIDNCECRNAVLDGIRIIPPSWTVTIRNTLSNSNGRDGLRSIMTSNPGVNQLNHIMIDSCTFNDNTGDGINILGVINTITNCDIENNSMGIRMDATQCADPYASFHLNIVDNYIEGNKTNQIYASTNTGDGIVLNVKGNYINSANLGGAIIKCVGISEAMTLNLGENRFESSVTNTVMLDGGNCLNSSSLIISDVYLNESKFINLGFARIIQDMFGTIMLPSSMSTAPSNNVQASDDITLKTPKKVEYPVPIDLQFKLLKLLQAKIVTNATSYNITCTVKVIDLLGNEVRSIPYTITGTANQTWSVYITNDWGYYRIPKENFVTVSFLVNSITAGSYITINNVCLSCI